MKSLLSTAITLVFVFQTFSPLSSSGKDHLRHARFEQSTPGTSDGKVNPDQKIAWVLSPEASMPTPEAWVPVHPRSDVAWVPVHPPRNATSWRGRDA